MYLWLETFCVDCYLKDLAEELNILPYESMYWWDLIHPFQIIVCNNDYKCDKYPAKRYLSRSHWFIFYSLISTIEIDNNFIFKNLGYLWFVWPRSSDPEKQNQKRPLSNVIICAFCLSLLWVSLSVENLQNMTFSSYSSEISSLAPILSLELGSLSCVPHK